MPGHPGPVTTRRRVRVPDDEPADLPRILAIPEHPRDCGADRLVHQLAGHPDDLLPTGVCRQATVAGLAGHHSLQGPENGGQERGCHHCQDRHRAGDFSADRSPGAGRAHRPLGGPAHRRICRRADAPGLPHLLGESAGLGPAHGVRAGPKIHAAAGEQSGRGRFREHRGSTRHQGHGD